MTLTTPSSTAATHNPKKKTTSSKTKKKGTPPPGDMEAAVRRMKSLARANTKTKKKPTTTAAADGKNTTSHPATPVAPRPHPYRTAGLAWLTPNNNNNNTSTRATTTTTTTADGDGTRVHTKKKRHTKQTNHSRAHPPLYSKGVGLAWLTPNKKKTNPTADVSHLAANNNHQQTKGDASPTRPGYGRAWRTLPQGRKTNANPTAATADDKEQETRHNITNNTTNNKAKQVTSVTRPFRQGRVSWLCIPQGAAVNQEVDENDHHPRDDDDNNNEKPENANKLFLPKWKILFLTGFVLMGLSTMAFVGHVRQNQTRRRNNNNQAPTASPDDDAFLQGAAENIFDQPNPCGPRAWPGLVGSAVNAARQQILHENRCVVVEIIIIVPGTTTTAAAVPYDPERVRLYMDRDTGTVARIPRVG